MLNTVICTVRTHNYHAYGILLHNNDHFSDINV
ncbi:MAG: hypothetical protein IJT36_08150 [Alphaproteobacteria bacterium]|nr:hypothetical protein [Alphaproteobacteria bacterium]